MSPVSEGWEAAIQTHLASLTPAQRKEFQSPASAEACLCAIENSKRNRRLTRILERMRPVIQPLNRFEGVIDVLVQTNGGIGSPIWGPLKFAATVRR